MSAAEENWDSVYSGVCGLVDRMITLIILDPPLMAFLCAKLHQNCLIQIQVKYITKNYATYL